MIITRFDRFSLLDDDGIEIRPPAGFVQDYADSELQVFSAKSLETITTKVTNPETKEIYNVVTPLKYIVNVNKKFSVVRR